MLTRIDDFFTFFAINESDRDFCIRAATHASERGQDMTTRYDYEALAAIALHYKPRRIFEIGTYLGITSDFFLSILPECKVVSIAYRNRLLRVFEPIFNNSELNHDQIGSEVLADRRTRFTQLHGNSHKIDSQTFVKEYGSFDLVFIDGDHTAKGVFLDTELAKKIITESGVICWHDANPKQKYMDVKKFLEEDLTFPAIATKDNYIGGIGAWGKEIEDNLK